MRLGISAPESMKICRTELYLTVEHNKEASDKVDLLKVFQLSRSLKALGLSLIHIFKPRYVVMREGDQEKRGKAEQENGQEVTGALVQAILVVKLSLIHI